VTLEDNHVLGKRIVYSALRASGYELGNYGQMQASDLVRRVVADRLQILLISVLMLPSALHVKDVVGGLQEAKHPVKIVVGGAPFHFDQQLWREVGADAFGETATDAVRIVHQLMEELA
jgi:methanogenic corrinoid protein MtbC1